jgi:hypothetical protein
LACSGAGRLRRPGVGGDPAGRRPGRDRHHRGGPPWAAVKQRDPHLSGRHLNQAVYYPRTFRGRRYLAPEWPQVPYTRAVAAVGELLEGEPDCPGSRRPFPAGTRLQGIDLEGGTAMVELSRSALPAARVARRWPLQALVHTVPAASASVGADGRPRTVLSHLVPAGSPFGQAGPLGRYRPCPLSSRTRRSLRRRPGYGP